MVNCIIFFVLSDQAILDQYFPLLCNCLPDNYQSTLDKLKSVPQLSNDDHQELAIMISSSRDAKLVNEKIITFLIVKLCYIGSSDSLVGLCDVMDNLIDCEELSVCLQQVRNGENKCVHRSHCICLTIAAVTEEASSTAMESSPQGSPFSAIEKLPSVTCTQYVSPIVTSSATVTSMSSLSATGISVSVNNEPVNSAEQEIDLGKMYTTLLKLFSTTAIMTNT